MTEADIKLIKMYWNSRLSIQQIVQMLPYKKGTAMSMIKALKADGTLPKRSVQDNTLQQVAEAYNSGVKSIYELAEMLDLTPKTVSAYLYKSGIKRDNKLRRAYKHSDKYHEISDAIKQGEESILQIARRFGVSRQYVYQIKEKICI